MGTNFFSKLRVTSDKPVTQGEERKLQINYCIFFPYIHQLEKLAMRRQRVNEPREEERRPLSQRKVESILQVAMYIEK